MKIRKYLSIALLFLLCSAQANAQKLVGADVSWCTEMEANGKSFYDANGKKTELMQLLYDLGMRAIRLRVWVNPSYTSTPSESCYGSAYCDCADVVAKAKRAQAAGMDVMIDFHYSDFFADPSRQNVPNDWKEKSYNEIKTLVASHTTEVLTALQNEGVTPKWIQIGNETAGGMLSGFGDITYNPTNFSKFVSLYNAGYEAAKAACPSAYVMPHLNKGWADNAWWFKAFKSAGAKFDMIALSHYPQTDDTSQTPQTLNSNLATQINALYKTYKVPVMVAETGVTVNADESTATAVLLDLYDKLKDVDACAGIFYWEPELYNWWKPACYTKLGWGAYNMGAFKANGRPSSALTSFVQTATGIHSVSADNHEDSNNWYTLTGQQVSAPNRGIYLHDGKKVCKK